MNFFNQLERKFGRFAIKNLMMYLVILNIAGFVLNIIAPDMYYEYLCLDIGRILQGEVWRLLTWMLYTDNTMPLVALIFIYIEYMIGRSLSLQWGAFKFNVFIFTGLLFHILAAFMVYIISKDMPEIQYYDILITPSNLYTSIFLAFAISFPDMQFYLYFVIPIKAKILGGIYAIVELYYFLVGNTANRITIILCFLNVIIFFFLTRKLKRMLPSEVKRMKEFKFSSKITPLSRTIHKCAVCGRTEKDDEDLEFRYCSKCKGNYEYCSEHIFTHKHVE
ncbi:MAG: hypothetical protein Q4A19_03145 [Johnsonella sp.]|nr:hypothetical protein [Johnsonella sp.]